MRTDPVPCDACRAGNHAACAQLRSPHRWGYMGLVLCVCYDHAPEHHEATR